MCRPEEIRKELEEYNRPLQVEERSVNDCLNDTGAFINWAAKKYPQYDPENRRPIPVCIMNYSHLNFVHIFNFHT